MSIGGKANRFKNREIELPRKARLGNVQTPDGKGGQTVKTYPGSKVLF